MGNCGRKGKQQWRKERFPFRRKSQRDTFFAKLVPENLFGSSNASISSWYAHNVKPKPFFSHKFVCYPFLSRYKCQAILCLMYTLDISRSHMGNHHAQTVCMYPVSGGLSTCTYSNCMLCCRRSFTMFIFGKSSPSVHKL